MQAFTCAEYCAYCTGVYLSGARPGIGSILSSAMKGACSGAPAAKIAVKTKDNSNNKSSEVLASSQSTFGQGCQSDLICEETLKKESKHSWRGVQWPA